MTAELYECCEHCTHHPDLNPDQHTRPCPEGCNGTPPEDEPLF